MGEHQQTINYEKPKRYALGRCFVVIQVIPIPPKSYPSPPSPTPPNAMPVVPKPPHITHTTELCISNTRLLIPMMRRISCPLRWPVSISSPSPLLSASHPGFLRHGSSGPSSLHGRWRHRLRATRSARSPAASDQAAQDGKQEETADTTADADDEVSVVVDPAADLFGRRGALALPLCSVSGWMRWSVAQDELTF